MTLKELFSSCYLLFTTLIDVLRWWIHREEENLMIQGFRSSFELRYDLSITTLQNGIINARVWMFHFINFMHNLVQAFALWICLHRSKSQCIWLTILRKEISFLKGKRLLNISYYKLVKSVQTEKTQYIVPSNTFWWLMNNYFP